jgi:hypothetical protein
MSNGLQKLCINADSIHPDTTEIASVIVKQLPHLKIIELNCHNQQVPETLHILINGLLKLNFIMIDSHFGGINKLHSELRDLQKYNIMRVYRIEYCDLLLINGLGALCVWL